MPSKSQYYHSDYLFPYFFNMLSEGANRQIQSTLLHIDENDDFGILLACAPILLFIRIRVRYSYL